jgi:antirestriction protein ArdC
VRASPRVLRWAACCVAAYLCAEAGITDAVIENQAAYVAGWLKKLRDDRKLLIHAAAQAQHAADYILRAPRTV